MFANNHSNPKFTRGEKCIFFHLVLVFVAILILLIIFIIHLYIINHTDKSTVYFRRSAAISQEGMTYPPVGVVYLNMTPIMTICNSVLLRAKWSISPANCIVAYSNPDLAYVLTMWRITYEKRSTHTTEIKRGVAHPQFNRDTFTNNIGLFEHVKEILIHNYFISTKPKVWKNRKFNNYLHILTRGNTDKGRDHVHLGLHIDMEKCVQYLSFIVDVRSYEFCIVPEDRNVTLEYGALILINNDIIGIHSWGERKIHHIPFVILNITYFHDWLNTIVL